MQKWHRQLGVDYFFPGGDMHWNAAGHEAAARAVGKRVLQLVAR